MPWSKMFENRWLVVFAAVFSGLTYNNWLLGFLLNPRLLKATGSVSEYSAQNQPHHLIFQSLDILSGILLVVLGGLVWARLRQNRFGKILVVGTILFGLANVVDALLPLSCSETLSQYCQIPISISLHHIQLPGHAYSSTTIAICYLGLPVLAWLLGRNLRLKPVVVASAGSIVIALVSFITAINQYLSQGSLSVRTSGSGQQVQMLIIGAWLVVTFWFIALLGSPPARLPPKNQLGKNQTKGRQAE